MGDKKKVLVVDGDARLIALARGIFDADYEVHTAPDGATGLKKAKEIIPDLILLDVTIPGMTVLDFARELSACRETACIPIIVDQIDLLQTLK